MLNHALRGIFRTKREVVWGSPDMTQDIPDLRIPRRRIVSIDGLQTSIKLFWKDVLHSVISVEDLVAKFKLKSASKGVTFHT